MVLVDNKINWKKKISKVSIKIWILKKNIGSSLYAIRYISLWHKKYLIPPSPPNIYPFPTVWLRIDQIKIKKKGRKSILSFAKLWASLRDGLVESCSGFRLLSLEGRIKNGCNSNFKKALRKGGVYKYICVIYM